MNFNSSMKKLACFLLAILMLLGTVGCKDNGGSTKKKKIIKKKVVVVNNDEQTDNNTQNNNNNNINIGDSSSDSDVKPAVRRERDLPSVAEDGLVILDDPIVDEFDHEYQPFNLNGSYVIIYGLTKWDNRYEGYANYNTASQKPIAIEYTAENRLAAEDIKTWVKDNYNFDLPVYEDSVYTSKVNSGELTGNEKKILVGFSDYNPESKSSLAENQFEVKVDGNNLVFNGGHFAMVESAVDWFRSVEIQEGKVVCLTSKNKEFKSQVVVNGVTYDYIWGDEFDGYEFNDDQKWAQSTFGLERQDDMANIFDDPHFQYVENGKIRLTGDRYYDEGNAGIGYATSGQVDTNSSAIFRNGYFEFYARLPYRRGGFPAIWTMTADAMNTNVPNANVNDGYGIYNKRFWDLEFDLFESFADADHMTTTIHKWYTNRNSTTLSKEWYDLTLEEEMMVEADLANAKGPAAQRYNWTVENPSNRDKDWVKKCDEHKIDQTGGNRCVMYYYVENNQKVYVCEGDISDQNRALNDGTLEMPEEDTWQYMLDNNILKMAHMRTKTVFHFNDGSELDTFKYRLSPYTNMSTSMATYAYSFSYEGSPSERRQDPNGMYGNWRWYFNEDTINNEYHLYSFHYTSTHCTVYMDGEKFLDFDWDPAYDYKDTNGDGKGDDISNNNNGVGFNFWQYFLIDMMIYTPGNFNIDYARKIQVGDCPFHLYIDYVRFYQDLDDTSQAVHYLNGVGKN